MRKSGGRKKVPIWTDSLCDGMLIPKCFTFSAVRFHCVLVDTKGSHSAFASALSSLENIKSRVPSLLNTIL